jgi:parallel beta-helix repeat protein
VIVLAVPEEAVQWYRDQRQQGFSREELVQLMQQNGYVPTQIKEIITLVEGELLPIEEMQLYGGIPAPERQASSEVQKQEVHALAPLPGEKKPAPQTPTKKPVPSTEKPSPSTTKPAPSKPKKGKPRNRLAPSKPSLLSKINFKLLAAVLVVFVVVVLFAAFVLMGGPDLFFINQTVTPPSPSCIELKSGENVIDKSTCLENGKYENPYVTITKGNVVVDCNNAILSGVGSGTAFQMDGVENVKITGCTIQNYGYGIQASNSQNLDISENNLIDMMGDGISLSGSSNVKVYFNQIEGFKLNGIKLTQSNKNTFSGNDLTGDGTGILVQDSSNNLFLGNTLLSNRVGVAVREGSEFNVFENNDVCDSQESDLLCETTIWGSNNKADSVRDACKWVSFTNC